MAIMVVFEYLEVSAASRLAGLVPELSHEKNKTFRDDVLRISQICDQ